MTQSKNKKRSSLTIIILLLLLVSIIALYKFGSYFWDTKIKNIIQNINLQKTASQIVEKDINLNNLDQIKQSVNDQINVIKEEINNNSLINKEDLTNQIKMLEEKINSLETSDIQYDLIIKLRVLMIQTIEKGSNFQDILSQLKIYDKKNIKIYNALDSYTKDGMPNKQEILQDFNIVYKNIYLSYLKNSNPVLYYINTFFFIKNTSPNISPNDIRYTLNQIENDLNNNNFSDAYEKISNLEPKNQEITNLLEKLNIIISVYENVQKLQ